MSKELKKFLRAWLWWVMTGAQHPNKYNFRRSDGLCWSISKYTRYKSLGYDIQNQLMRMFMANDLNVNYPFGYDDFDERDERGTMHLCPKRVGWVIKVLEENPDA